LDGGIRGGPPGGARDCTLAATAGVLFGLFVDMVLQDPQIRDGVGERIAEAGLDAAWREGVQLLALRVRNIQFALPDPCVGDGEIVGDRHRQLIDRRLVLISGGKPREVSQQDRRAAEER